MASIAVGVAIGIVGTLGVALAFTRGGDADPAPPGPVAAPTVTPPTPAPSPSRPPTPREEGRPQYRHCNKTAGRLEDISEELAEIWTTVVDTLNRFDYINVDTGERIQALKTFSSRLDVLRERSKPLKIPSRLGAPERLLRRSIATATRAVVLLRAGLDEGSVTQYAEGADLLNGNWARVRAFARASLTLRCAQIIGRAADD